MSTNRSAEELVKRVLLEPGVLEKIKADPAKTLQELANQVIEDLPYTPPLESDRLIYRIVVSALGIVVVLSVLGAIILTFRHTGDTKIPETLTALGSASIGALAGLLAPSPVHK